MNIDSLMGNILSNEGVKVLRFLVYKVCNQAIVIIGGGGGGGGGGHHMFGEFLERSQTFAILQ